MSPQPPRMTLSIAPLRDDEVEALCVLAREIWRCHYPPIIGQEQTEYMLAQRYDPAVVRDELARGDIWWDTLSEAGEMLAFASSFPVGPGEVKLDKLYVRPDRQRVGYGAALIEHACGRAARLGYERLVLAVNKRNAAAIAAYRKHGFRIREAVVKDIGGGFVMDDYVMERLITPPHGSGVGGAERSGRGCPIKLKFTKMQGLGNDFVVLDATSQPIALDAEQLRFIADRHFGVGCDQILQVEPPREAGTDFYYRIFNSDGGEVEQCGNGARCFVRFVLMRGLTDKTEIRVGTRSGVIVPRLEADGEVTVDMGVPVFEPREVPFDAPARAPTYPLEVGGAAVEVSVLSMGNPHAVQIVPDVDLAPVDSLGPLIEAHARFPRRVNAGFMQVVDRRRVRLRVYERGAGETLACGTGACAAVVAGVSRGVLDAEAVVVETRGGNLRVSWAGPGAPVLMTGPAQSVFEGEITV